MHLMTLEGLASADGISFFVDLSAMYISKRGRRVRNSARADARMRARNGKCKRKLIQPTCFPQFCRRRSDADC